MPVITCVLFWRAKAERTANNRIEGGGRGSCNHAPEMNAVRIWVDHGVFERVKEDALPMTPQDERTRLEAGQVRLTTGNIGTEVKWYVQTPCIASLFVVTEWLRKANAPYVLRFFTSGWFEEFYQTAGEAAQRIESVIARGDRHFPMRTFVQKVDPRPAALTSLIQHCLTTTDVPEELVVDCNFDQNTDRFVVRQVGSKSLMAKLYGQLENSFAHQSTGSFSDAVSEGYREVLNSGQPRTDHVLAALRLSNNQVHWVPYHRLILPVKIDGRKNGVRVVAEAARIGFKVI
jgi:hypothetical protein